MNDTDTAATAELVDELVRTCLSSRPTRSVSEFSSDPKTLAMGADTRSAFPDLGFEPSWRVVEGTRAVLGGQLRGTHLGEWRGVPATGRSIDVLAIMSIVCEGGRIVDMTAVNDSFEMAVQLGLVEQLGPKACQVVREP